MTGTESFDVIVVGAGPTGLSCAIECTRHNLTVVVIEKGCLANSIYHFPSNMTFFTTSDLLEIGDIPFTSANAKPTREEGLNYYKRVVQSCGLAVRTNERVMAIRRDSKGFTLSTRTTNNHREYASRFVILATGYYDNPNRLGIPGEDLPKVSHYYTDPHPYFDKNVLIIGGKNSACIAALELHRYGARVTVVHRRTEIRESVKYWILPDFQNRVKEGRISLHLQAVVEEITPNDVTIRRLSTGEDIRIANDFVLALTGYRPDSEFLSQSGVRIDPVSLIPEHDPASFETNVPGLYVAGSVSAGIQTNKLFIENGRFHGRSIVGHMMEKR